MEIEGNIPIWEKQNLTIEEAALYSNIGVNRLREIASNPLNNITLYVGRKMLIKKRAFDKWIENQTEV